MSAVSDSEFFDALGGGASTGFDTEGRDVGLALLAMPDGSVKVTLAVDVAPGQMHFTGIQVPPGLAAEWGLLLSTVARHA